MEGIKATGMTKQQQNGVPILIAVICFFVYWLTASPTPKVEMQEPSKDLIEQVASVKESMEVAVDEPKQDAKPEILMFVGRNCPPCEKWKRAEMQKFIDAGWSVGIVEVHRFTITPTFEITGKETVTHQGYLTFKQAGEMLK